MAESEEPQRIEQRQNLLAWFDRLKRDLPWRRSRDPYPVWVSEIMLQQTRVDTARPYFERFIQAFPSVEDLASAEVEAVLGQWSGLGYYQRARRLHAAARQIVAGGGTFPSNVEEWLQLPGVGPYTAAAIASIVLGIPEPAIDGNVMRVVGRLLALEEDPRKRSGHRAIRNEARHLLDLQRPGDSNQAIMELGATICLPRRPRCSLCPLEQGCLAVAAGDPELFPVTGRKAPMSRHYRHVVVVESQGRVLLFRRPGDSPRMAGLWEFPWIDGRARGQLESALGQRYGGHWKVESTRGRVNHSVTNRSFQIEVVEASLSSESEVAEGPEAAWFSNSDLADRPVTGLVGKVLKLLED
jgi:A/G-specific adenine glycosylase